MRKKLLSIILSLSMVLTMVPMIGSVAYAGGTTTISTVNLTCDIDKIDLNTAWTEGEVQSRVGKGTGFNTTGIKECYRSLMYNGVPDKPLAALNIWGIGYGTDKASETRDYVLEYWLEPEDGYDWPASAKNENNPEDISGITVMVNGVDKTDDCVYEYNAYWNALKVYYVIGKASTSPRVTNVTISDADISLEKGGTHAYSGTVAGTATDKTIQWSVEGANSVSTTISNTGLLTIGSDETAETISVVATATADSSKKASVKVTVMGDPQYIDSVALSPKEVTGYCGSTRSFTAEVTGTQLDKSVIWTVEGANSAYTSISDSGVLSIGTDETAKTLTVMATANQDITKYDTATVTLAPKSTVKTINLSYDKKNLNLNTADTEGEVQSRVGDSTDVTTKGISENSGRSLMYNAFPEVPLVTASIYGIGYGTDKVSETRDYVLEYCLELEDGYDWPAAAKKENPGDISGITVIINGVDKTDDCVYEYNAYWNELHVYYVIGKVAKDKIKTVKLSETTYTYSGKAKNPAVTVITEQGLTLAIGKKASYENEDVKITYPTGRKSVGTYTIKVAGKGGYTGSISKTFKIVPAAPSIKSLSSGTKKLSVKMTAKPSAKGASTYQIYYKQKGTSAWKKTTTTSSSKTIKSLKKGKQYYVKVRAYKKVGTETYYSAFSKTSLTEKIK